MPIDRNRLNALFPVTQSDIYLNHAAISPFSTHVLQAINFALTERSTGVIDTYQQGLEEKDKLKSNLAALIHGKKEHIALITNTSEGLNWFVNSLRWQPGDRILLVEGEFPTNIYPFMNMERRGIEIDFVPLRNGAILLEDIEKMITGKTRLLSISFVEFFTGFRNDLKTIGQLCKSKKVLLSVDGIQGVGAIPLNVEEAQIDFLANGGHKWLMGPMGSGFMYLRPEIIQQMDPVFAGWLSVKDSWNFLDYRLDFLDDAARFEMATQNYLGICGLRAATDLLVENNPDNTFRHLLELGDRMITGLRELGMEYIGSEERAHRSGIYTFKTNKAEDLTAYLKKQKIQVSLRNGAMRVSPHFYNSLDEIDQLISQCRHFYGI